MQNRDDMDLILKGWKTMMSMHDTLLSLRSNNFSVTSSSSSSSLFVKENNVVEVGDSGSSIKTRKALIDFLKDDTQCRIMLYCGLFLPFSQAKEFGIKEVTNIMGKTLKISKTDTRLVTKILYGVKALRKIFTEKDIGGDLQTVRSELGYNFYLLKSCWLVNI